MNNSKEEMAKEAKESKDVVEVDGQKVDTKTGEVLDNKSENTPKTEKRVMTETEAREYMATLPFYFFIC